MEKITKQQILDSIESTYSTQKDRILEDIISAENCLKSHISTYDKLQMVVVIENHLKNLLIETLTDLLVKE